MPDLGTPEGTPQGVVTGAAEVAPTPQTTVPAPVNSDLARLRAQQQASQAPAVQPQQAGQVAPGDQNAQDATRQREGFIPRERFDEVNARRIAAEGQLSALQAQRAAQANQNPGGYLGPYQQPQAAQPSPQAQQAQVQDLIASLGDKATQEQWRQKIINNPVTGIAELIRYALQTEGQALLQQHIAPLQQQARAAQVEAATRNFNSYVTQRQSDASWAQVGPVFTQLANQAVANGVQINSQTLSVIETVARQQAGVPVFGTTAPVALPFTERPGGGGAVTHSHTPAPQLTPQQLEVAQRFGLSPAEYAAAVQRQRV